MIGRMAARRLLRPAAFCLVAVLASSSLAAPTVRVKDVARLAGVRDNQLVGYGIVVGLQGTGDTSRSRFTISSVLAMLQRLGLRHDGQTFDPKNCAAVIVTVTLPGFATNGQRLDATISAIGDAESLDGGVLLQTPLLGADGKVYSVAQGSLSMGGGAGGGATGALAARAGSSGSTVKTTARIPGGAIVETDMQSQLIEADGTLVWVLKNPDFATASRLAESINAAYRPPIARAETADRIRVNVPSNFRANLIPFIARVEDLLLQPDQPARVVVNERTGTIVFGENVRISTVAVSHGALSVSIRGEVAPNAPAGSGPQAATVTVEENKENTLTLPEGSSVRDLVRSLNSIGAMPRDIIAVLQAVSAAGALHADLSFL